MKNLDIRDEHDNKVFQSLEAQDYFKKLVYTTEHIDEDIVTFLKAVVEDRATLDLDDCVVTFAFEGDRPVMRIRGNKE